MHVSQDVSVTSQEPLIRHSFALSDDDAESVSDTSLALGLSHGDLSGLEDIIDRYKDILSYYYGVKPFYFYYFKRSRFTQST